MSEHARKLIAKIKTATVNRCTETAKLYCTAKPVYEVDIPTLIKEVVTVVQSSFRTTDDEVESIVNMWVAKHLTKLDSLPTHLDRVRYSVQACKRAWLDYQKSERIRKGYEHRAGESKALYQDNHDTAMVDELDVYGVSPHDEDSTERLLDELAKDELDIVLEETNKRVA